MVPMSRDQIRRAALAMEPDDRAALAAELFDSLVEPADEEVDEAWEAEIEIDRRLDEIDQGTAQIVSVQQVFRRARRTP
jgi:putative addiction module component (TIGR02574 family)